MNAKTAFASAIELLTSDDIDYRSIVIRLAQTNPVLFVKLTRSEPKDNNTGTDTGDSGTPGVNTEPDPHPLTSRQARAIRNDLASSVIHKLRSCIRALLDGNETLARRELHTASFYSVATDLTALNQFIEWLSNRGVVGLPSLVTVDGHVEPNYVSVVYNQLRAVYLTDFA